MAARVTLLAAAAATAAAAAAAASSSATATTSGRAASAAVCAATSSSSPSAQPSSPSPRWSVRPIAGDGSCLFRAIVQGAQIADAGEALSPDDEEKGARALRKQVVHALRDHRDDIEPFLPGIAPDFERYCEQMLRESTWGGEPELAMASQHVLQRPLAVYSARLADRLAAAAGGGAAGGKSGGFDEADAAGLPAPVVTYGEQFLDDPSAPPVVRLVWSGNHYEPLVDEHRRRRLRDAEGGSGSGSAQQLQRQQSKL